MKIVISTIIVALTIGFLLGLLLGLFKKIFSVKVDPKIQAIRDALSGGNCGGCGYAGCDSFAEAVVKGDASPSGCVAGGADCASAIARIMGSAGSTRIAKIAFLACNGTKESASDKGEYIGVKTCRAAQLVAGGTKKCSFGCIGFGDCAEVCPFDAICMGSHGLPVVNREKCVGCGKCVKACPKGLFILIPKDSKGAIARCSCRSDNKAQIKKDCSAGCFKCGICVRKCPKTAIQMVNGIPSIDRDKCDSCGECIKSCPDKVLAFL